MSLQTYQFGIQDVRVVDIEGSPWLVASDVCRAIGYAVKPSDEVNTWLALLPLAESEVITCRVSGNRGRASKVISESGLYKLIMCSDKPQARGFQDWVTKDVLPAIRKDGAYVMDKEKVATGEMSEDEFVPKAMGHPAGQYGTPDPGEAGPAGRERPGAPYSPGKGSCRRPLPHRRGGLRKEATRRQHDASTS